MEEYIVPDIRAGLLADTKLSKRGHSHNATNSLGLQLSKVTRSQPSCKCARACEAVKIVVYMHIFVVTNAN